MVESKHTTPRWMRGTMIAAGLYNLLWGSAVVAFPNWWFQNLGMPTPRYPAIWQCVGMIVGVYGVGYLAAAGDPRRHWPIVLVGLLGKILGPIGFLWAAGSGQVAWSLGLTIVTNDLVWWLPFGLILWSAAKRDVGAAHRGSRVLAAGDARSAIAETHVTRGETLGGHVVNVFRHNSVADRPDYCAVAQPGGADLEREGAV